MATKDRKNSPELDGGMRRGEKGGESGAARVEFQFLSSFYENFSIYGQFQLSFWLL